jgi:transcriptional regulator with GAF, ATPase, and Fis domain
VQQCDAFAEGDSFLLHFLPGPSPSVRALRAMIYRLNIEHKNHRMVPSILLLGEPGVGKGYTARVIAGHGYWLTKSKGMEVAPSGLDIYKIASDASLRIQTLTNLPDDLAEATLFGAKQGAYTDLKREIIGVFDTGAHGRRGESSPDPFDIFLDEIGDSSPKIQAKLLQVLEDRTFRPLGSSFEEREKTTDARVIIATNKDLAGLVKAGRFRDDLYSRLLWAVLQLPPLRDQLDQIPIILARMNESLLARYDLDTAVPGAKDIQWAQTYEWPGNHRELQQVLWEWHLFHGARTLEAIIQDRKTLRSDQTQGLEATVMQKLFERFEAILAGREPGFTTYGMVVDQLQRLAYAAMYRFNQKRRLTDQDLELLFSEQKAINVRKQISDNRPKDNRD